MVSCLKAFEGKCIVNIPNVHQPLHYETCLTAREVQNVYLTTLATDQLNAQILVL